MGLRRVEMKDKVYEFHWNPDGTIRNSVKETANHFGISKTAVRRACRHVKGESCGHFGFRGGQR